ncbi:SusC/RagA family TonB-linked outer membrane protein [Flexithrix dorotheae]|uniref:SusC/RagA family TonB-linked outer membrane protein n=1 Tax=Flexithrix dorotheae TaxID=70993 RepID=UPI0005C5E01C|nr:SusC/RagA family TonB-linked outer membrane protein [Flexithrix dorotheae]
MAYAQSRIVTGTVTADQGKDPLPGVNVLIKGTATGTVTDINGKFSIDAPPDGILVFSFIGYQTLEEGIMNRSVVDITLEADVQQLSEVVVTAFGIEREKKAIGYSAQEVKGEDLSIARETNVMNGLKGKVAGVHVNSSSAGVGGSSFVSIRGNSSLSGNNQPLYVVDGVPINNDNLGAAGIWGGRDYGDGIQNINPDDIESLSVLKGPNAAALYGSRGSNGVILITTKTSAKKGIGVSFNSNATFEEPNVLPTFQNKYAGGYDDDFSAWNTQTIDGVEYPVYPGWLLDQWGPKMEGQLVGIQTLPELGLVPLVGQPEDNIRNFYRTGKTFTNTLAVTTGSDKINFRLSVSNLTNEGILPNSSFDRNTVNMNIGANVTDKLRVEAKANYVNQKGKNRPVIGQSSSESVAPSLNLMGRHVDLDWLKEYKTEDGAYRNWKNNSPTNPYWIVNEFLTEDQRDRVIGFVSANYEFTDWLSLMARVGSDFYTDIRSERVGQGTPGSARRDGIVKENMYNVKELNTDIILTAKKDFSENFTGSLNLGLNKYNYKLERVGYTGTKLDIPDLYQITNTLNLVATPAYIRKETHSVFFNGQLGYKNFLFLDVTGRNDWSSTLGVNNYSFFYPSSSLSFVFTDALQVDSNILTFGKLRVSYAEAGNDATPYQTITGYAISQNTFKGQRYASVTSNVKNADLKNELTSSFEAGTDIRFFNNRLSVDFTYYNSSTINQILPAEISASTGYSTLLVNAGEIKNEGIELLLSGTPISMSNTFKWDLSVNFSKNKSKVVSLIEDIDSYTLISTSNASIEARPGESFGNIVGFPYKRNEEGRFIITELGSYQRDNERVVLGNIQPDWLAGITNTFSFKGFSLSGLLDVRKGGQIYSFSKYDQTAKGTGKFTENRDNLVADGVVENEDGSFSENTQVVAAQAYYAQKAWGNIGEEFVMNADYVSLREASFSYNFNSSMLSKTPFRTAQLSIVGRNLLYLYRDPQAKLMGISPENAFAPTAAAQGYEFASIPTTRSIGFNLSLTF